MGYVALAVVALDAGEVGVRDAHELGARQAVVRRDRFRPCGARRSDLVDALGRFAVADHERLDLGDFAVRDAQARDQDRRRVGFADGAHEHRLPALHVREFQRVTASARGRVPQAFAEREPLAVLRESHFALHG